MSPDSKDSYDYIVVGAGASGSVVAGELSKTGAEVLVVESGGADAAPTISNPSIDRRSRGRAHQQARLRSQPGAF